MKNYLISAKEGMDLIYLRKTDAKTSVPISIDEAVKKEKYAKEICDILLENHPSVINKLDLLIQILCRLISNQVDRLEVQEIYAFCEVFLTHLDATCFELGKARSHYT